MEQARDAKEPHFPPFYTHTHTNTHNTHTHTHIHTHVYLLASFVSPAHCRVQYIYSNTHKYTMQHSRQRYIYLYSKQMIRSVGPQQATELAGWPNNGSPYALSSVSRAVCRSHRVTVLAGFRLDRKQPYPNNLH